MNDIGVMLENGTSIKKDVEAAAAWYQKSAIANNLTGMNNFGSSLVIGMGVVQDVPAGMSMLREAARKDGVLAAESLAEFLDAGKEVGFDFAGAAKFYLQALKGGNSAASTALITSRGKGLNPITLDALQAQLKAEGKSFTVRKGALNDSIVNELKAY